MLRHGERLLADTKAAGALEHKIELFRLDVLVQRVRTLRRHAPETGTEILTAGAFEKIGIRNAHSIRGTPVKIIRRVERVALEGLHEAPYRKRFIKPAQVWPRPSCTS